MLHHKGVLCASGGGGQASHYCYVLGPHPSIHLLFTLASSLESVTVLGTGIKTESRQRGKEWESLA